MLSRVVSKGFASWDNYGQGVCITSDNTYDFRSNQKYWETVP
jgi:hypothetical protein